MGSCRRDLLDHVIILNERHLERLMSSYLLYYHEDRTHLGLAKDTPASRPTEIRSARENKVQSFPRLGGRHHRYAVAAQIREPFSDDQTLLLVHCKPAEDGSCLLSEHLSLVDESACNPKPNNLAKEKEILLMWCTTIWRTTTAARPPGYSVTKPLQSR